MRVLSTAAKDAMTLRDVCTSPRQATARKCLSQNGYGWLTSRSDHGQRKMQIVMRGFRGSRGRPDPTNDQTPTLKNFKSSSHLRVGVWSFVGSTAASNGRVGTGGRNEILYFWVLGGIGGSGDLVEAPGPQCDLGPQQGVEIRSPAISLGT